MGRKKSKRKNKKRRSKASPAGVPSAGATSGAGMAKFDEKWLRLALVIHEAPTVALKSVLDKAISKKYADLASEIFEEKLNKSLIREESHKKNILLGYEVPTVFPSSGCPGAYDTFDVGIVCRLIKYFVGKVDFDKETSSLPRKPVPGTKQPNIDFEKLETGYLASASELALVEVIREYRNFVCHRPCIPVFSDGEFNHHWNNLMKTLEILGYDVGTLRCYRLGPLDYSGRLVVDTMEEHLKEAMRSMRDDLASKKDVNELKQLVSHEVERIDGLLEKFQADRQNVLNEMKELHSKMAKKEELHDLKEKFHAMIATYERRLRLVEEKVEVHDKKLEVHDNKIQKIEQKLNGAGELTGIQNADKASLQERKQRAQEACKSVHERFLKSRERDIFGDQMEGVRKSDLMVSLTTVQCRDLDSSRRESASDIQKFVTGYSANSNTVALQDLFKTDDVVLLRGYPGAGKSTLCHFILKEWKDGRLWSDQFDFVFYVNAPRLVTLLKEQPFDTQRVLAALYPDVFKEINYEELREFKCLIMVDAIDECDIERVCSPEQKGSFEEAINHIITSSETKFHRIILGRPSACDAVRRNLLENVDFEFVEVNGFTLEQVKEYVDKFCSHNELKPEDLWQRIRDNNTLLQMAHLPIFANVICNVLSENAKVKIKTETELYIWSYFVLQTRHRIRPHGDKLKPSTFKDLFNDKQVVDELVKVSKMAYEKLRDGVMFFSSRDFDLAGISKLFVSPFIVDFEEYLSFSHLTQMEFFAAVHLFVTCYESLDERILGTKHLQGVLVMFFGLLGGAGKNSDSAQIVRDFVQPLMKKFKMKPLEKHPLCGGLGLSLFHVDEFNELYVHSCFEFQNSLLLKDTDFSLGVRVVQLFASQHRQIDRIVFFMKRVIVEEQRLLLGFVPNDRRFSEAECRKLRHLIELRARNMNFQNIDFLALGDFAISGEMMEELAPALVLVPTVCLVLNKISEESWNIFLGALQNSVINQTRRIEKLWYYSSDGIPAAVSDQLRRVGTEVTVHLDDGRVLWLRLALVIDEAATAALKSVLDKSISKKYTDLTSEKTFEEKLNISLVREQSHMNKFLLPYEVPTLFPSSGCPGTYDTFEVGTVCRLIKYFVGKADFDKAIASLPGKRVPGKNQQNFDFERLETVYLSNANEMALVEVIREYRNFVFRHTPSQVLSIDEFNHHWDNLILTLKRLGYDVAKVSGYRSTPLGGSEKLPKDAKELLSRGDVNVLDEKVDVHEVTVHLDEGRVLWLRLALVIDEAATAALKSVLDEAISTKYPHLKIKSFEEKLNISLILEQSRMNKFLLPYEVPTLFPSSRCPGTYDTFEVFTVCRLIRYFVGKADFDKAIASLPRKRVPEKNQQNFDFERLETVHLASANELALVEVIREYRNFVYHHPASRHLSIDEFIQHWDNLMLTLKRLGYDTGNVSGYRSGPVSTAKKLLKDAMRSKRKELDSKKFVNVNDDKVEVHEGNT